NEKGTKTKYFFTRNEQNEKKVSTCQTKKKLLLLSTARLFLSFCTHKRHKKQKYTSTFSTIENNNSLKFDIHYIYILCIVLVWSFVRLLLTAGAVWSVTKIPAAAAMVKSEPETAKQHTNKVQKKKFVH